MKTKVFNTRLAILTALLLISLPVFAQRNKNDDFNGTSKTYSKSYPVTADDKLKIENSFGKVIINTWDKNEFKVDVQIKVSATNGNDQKLLDAITISDNKNGSTITFKTNIDKHSLSSQKMAINYTVYMPSKNTLDINDQYGAIQLPDFEGRVMINSAFGSFTAQSLTNNANSLNLSYSNATIESLKTCKIFIEFGHLNLGSADQLTANFSYSPVKIGKLTTSGNFNISFSSVFQIDNLDKNMKNLSVTSSYSTVKVGLSGDENANFDVTIENGRFIYDGQHVNVLSKTPPDSERGWSPTKNYKGRLGNGDANKMISVNSSFGTVKFN